MTPESRFAAVTPENVNLLYLRRTLLHKLLEDPETFEAKVIGCFVRARMADQDDYSYYQLFLVTGVKQSKRDGEIYLHVSDIADKFNIDSVSESDIQEEECLDLLERMKCGLIPKPALMDIQEKANALHEDITNHWIDTEWQRLRRRIRKYRGQGRMDRVNDLLLRENLLLNRVRREMLDEMPVVKAAPLTAFPDSRRRGKKRGEGSRTEEDMSTRRKRQNTGEIASRLPPPHPYFPFRITKSSTRSGVPIRRGFVQAHLRGVHGPVSLRLPEGRETWTATVIHKAGACGWISGWNVFAADNHLRPGHFCFFRWHPESRAFSVYCHF